MTAKAVIIIAVLTGWGWFWFHQGGLAGKAALAADHAAMAKAATQALLAQRAQAAAELTHQQKVISNYEATRDVPDPASIGTAHRVFVVAAAGGCSVPAADPSAGRAPEPSRVAIGPSEVERRLDDYVQACGRDVDKLRALQALAGQ